MTDSTKARSVTRGISCSIFGILFLLTCCALSAQNEQHHIRNVVLVHGAWADGSGWKVSATFCSKTATTSASFKSRRPPLRKMWLPRSASLLYKMDRAFLSRIATVITEAGTDPSVAGLVYIAAHMPDAGENEADDGKRFPSALSKSGAIKKTSDGFTYLDPALFHELFAADLPAEQAAFMARSQVPNFADNFKAVITTAAWRTKPSWMLVATKDRTINPDLERWCATRAKSHSKEVEGASRAIYTSRPKEVAALIEDAATHAQ